MLGFGLNLARRAGAKQSIAGSTRAKFRLRPVPRFGPSHGILGYSTSAANAIPRKALMQIVLAGCGKGWRVI